MRVEHHKRRIARLREQLGRTPFSPVPPYRMEWSKTADGKSVLEIHHAGGGTFTAIGARGDLEAIIEANGPKKA